MTLAPDGLGDLESIHVVKILEIFGLISPGLRIAALAQSEVHALGHDRRLRSTTAFCIDPVGGYVIGTLVLVSIVAAVIGGQAGRRSGKVWAYVTVAGFVTLAASLLWISALLFHHPGWGPPPDDLGKLHGRGAGIIVGVWLFFNSIGPKGTALILGVAGLLAAISARNQLIAIRAGCYAGMDEQERTSAQWARYLALIEKLKALNDANELDAKWVQAQPTKYPNREEAEKVAAAINATNARRADRQKEINSIVARARQLQVELGIHSSSSRNEEPDRVPSGAA